jgi:mannose/cellobiose epimerase-like protein (N-acyl-D-glucosamine 2-epimerase family)
MQAWIANEAGDPARALEVTATALGFPDRPQDPQMRAWPELERARALLALHRAGEARPLLGDARGLYQQLNLPARVNQIDALLR